MDSAVRRHGRGKTFILITLNPYHFGKAELAYGLGFSILLAVHKEGKEVEML